MKKIMMALVALTALVAGTMVASAEGRGGGNGPCKADIERLCGDVEGKRARMQCLQDNEDQLSDACVEKMEKKREKRAERKAAFEAACGADAEAMCSGLERKELRQCMKANRDNLSDQCVEHIEETRKHHRGQRGHRGNSEAREAVKAACSADAEALCSGLERKELRQCMKANRDDLSSQCTDAIEAAHAARKSR